MADDDIKGMLAEAKEYARFMLDEIAEMESALAQNTENSPEALHIKEEIRKLITAMRSGEVLITKS